MYTGTRLGIYTSLFSHFSSGGKPPNLVTKLGIASTAGSIGAFVGTPAELCLIRMTTDKSLPIAERRNYKNVFDALYRVVKDEGFTTLWRGEASIVAHDEVNVHCSPAKKVFFPQ